LKAPEICPICGADVPRNAKACPKCGACEKSGWPADADYDRLDLPDEDFDYDEFLTREFGKEKITPKSANWFLWFVVVVALLALLLLCSIPFFQH